MKTPITLKIKFKSSSLDQFIERYSVDVSRGGIFIRTKEPLPVGTTLRFEFQLQDGSSLIGGEGTVVWNRAYDPGRTGVAPGMGVRFDKLTADSQRVLERILSEKHKRGEAQLESRFDAGVRASREARSSEFLDSGTPLPAPAPGLSHGGFGDEPTRMMAADQMNQLAEQTKSDEGFGGEQPTRRASLAEIHKAVTAPESVGPSGSSVSAGVVGTGRTGRTGEQVRLGSGASSPVVARGINIPTGRPGPAGSVASTPTKASPTIAGPAFGSQPNPVAATPSTPAPAVVRDTLPSPPPGDALRKRLAAEQATLLATAAPPPPTTEPPAAHLASTLVGATVPSIPSISGGPSAHQTADTVIGTTAPFPRQAPSDAEGMGTLISPPPPESLDFLSALEAAARHNAQPADPDIPPIDVSAFTEQEDTQQKASGLPFLSGQPSQPNARPDDRPKDQAIGQAVGQANGQLGAQVNDQAAADTLMGSAISLSIPPVDVDLSQAEPLNPQDFAVPSPALHDEPATAVAPSDAATGPRPAKPAPPQSATRLTWYVIPLVLAVVLAAMTLYGLYAMNMLPGFTSKPAEPVPPPPPQQVRHVLAPPPTKAEPAGEPAATPEGQKDGQKKPEATKEPAKENEQADKDAVAITSDPPGAAVDLDGASLGVTPAQAHGLVAGKSYEVTLTLPGYQTGKVHIKGGDSHPVSVKLTPYERVIDVTSTPKGAEVLLDGKKVPGRTPLVIKHLDMKKVHQIEVRKGGFTPQTRNVSETDAFAVKSGREVLSLALTLEPGGPPLKKEHEEHPHDRRKDKDADKGDDRTSNPDGKSDADTKPDTKNDTKTDSKPDTKIDSKNDTRSDTKNDNKPDTKNDTKNDNKPAPDKDTPPADDSSK